MDENFLQQKAEAVENAGIAHYGPDDWKKLVGAVSRGNPNSAEAFKQAVGSGAAPDVIAVTIGAAGQEFLLTAADNGDKSAEQQYNQIRERRRQEHRNLKGRR